MQRGRLPVLYVHADLHDPRPRQLEAERTDAGEPAAALAHDGRDLARSLDRGPGHVDVERDQRPARADDHAACALVQPSRPEVRRQASRTESPPQLVDTATPEER